MLSDYENSYEQQLVLLAQEHNARITDPVLRIWET